MRLQILLFLYTAWLFIQHAKAQEISTPKISADRMAYIRGELRTAIKKNDPRLLAEAWYLYGKTYAGIGDFKSSQAYFLKSLRLLEPYGNSYELGRLYLRFCNNEMMQEHFEESLRNLNKAEKIFRVIRSEQGILSCYGNLSRIYRARWDGDSLKDPGKFDSLLSIFRKTEFLAKKQNDKLLLAETSLNLGNLLAKPNPEQAITYINKSVELYSKINETGTASAYLASVPVHVHTKRFGLAREALEKSREFYSKKGINASEFQMMFLTNSVLYYRATGNWEKAFETLEALSRAEKNELNADRKGAITRLNLEFAQEKREKLLIAQRKEIELKHENLRTQRQLSWTLTLLLFITTVAGLFLFRLNKKNERTSRWNAQLLEEQNHRVKNNLQIVSSLLNMQSKRLTDQSAIKAVKETLLRVDSMAILHRRLYDGQKLAEVNLAEFIEEIVLGVLKSFGYDHVHPSFIIEPIFLSADKALRVGLIVNELSTNSCKYAFPHAEVPRLRVSCFSEKQKIRLIMEDNGPGMDSDQLELNGKFKDPKNGTLGLSLIQTQVVQLLGTGFVSRKSAESGTEFNLEFKS